MTAVIYYGAPKTSDVQTIGEAVRLMGLSLIKSTVRNIQPVGILSLSSIQYNNYINNIHVAISSAYRAVPVAINEHTNYISFSNKKNLQGYDRLSVVWNYKDTLPALDQVALDAMKGKYQPEELKIHGEPSFHTSSLSLSSLMELKNSGANTTCPTVAGTLNISAAIALTKIQRLAVAFLTTHQYPLHNTTIQDSKYTDSIGMGAWGASRKVSWDSDNSGMSTEGVVYSLASLKDKQSYVFHMNGITPVASYNIYIGSSASIPNHSGFLFPFIADLAKDEDNLVPEIIEKYFLKALGDDRDTALGVLENIKTGWGVIRKTEYGYELAHIFSAIQLAIDTGALVKLIFGVRYSGFVLSGEQFSLYHRGDILDPVPFTDLQTSFDDAVPSTTALNKILELINLTPAELIQYKTTNRPTTIHQLKALILSKGYNINNEQGIRSAALHLSFPAQPYLVINAHNIARIFNAMVETPTQDHVYPLHPLYLLSSNRNHRLLSAFGEHGPTFLIPTGRHMDLEGTFSYKDKKGAKTSHTVTKMHVQIVPIGKATQDLDVMLKDKKVYSPIGTPLMRQISTLSVYREFSDNAGTEVLASIRRAAGVAPTNTTVGAGGSNKRKNVGGGVGGTAAKKAKIDSAMDI